MLFVISRQGTVYHCHPASASWAAGIAVVHFYAQLVLVIGSPCLLLGLASNGDPPVSVFGVAGITDLYHHTQPKELSL
jgi:hypothetical protein